MSIFSNEHTFNHSCHPDLALINNYPGLKVEPDHVKSITDYIMDGNVIYSVHFLQNANFELYRNIETAIQKYLKEKDMGITSFGGLGNVAPTDPIDAYFQIRIGALEKDIADLRRELKELLAEVKNEGVNYFTLSSIIGVLDQQRSYIGNLTYDHLRETFEEWLQDE